MHNVAPPAAHIFRTNNLIHARAAPPGVNPDRDAFAIGVTNEFFDLLNMLDIRSGIGPIQK